MNVATQPVRTFYQGGIPPREPNAPPLDEPDCESLLRCLDAIIDDFNGDYDKGDKSSLLHVRHAVWRKARKYESEDLNDVLISFFRLVQDPVLVPSDIDRYADSVRQGLRLECPERLAPFEAELQKLLSAQPLVPSQLYSLASRFGGQLWLRAALAIGLPTPSPWPVFPAALKQRLDGADARFEKDGPGEWWGREQHDDATYGLRVTLRTFEKKGWRFDMAKLDEAAQAKIDRVQDASLADVGIFRVKKAD
jgi:hypothetical protein